MGKKTINNYGNYAEENNGEMKFIPTNSDDGVKWYKEWWFISLVIAIIGTVTFYFNFQSIGLSIGLGIILFLICLFFNPKRRFFRVANVTIVIGAVSLFPSIMDYISKVFDINIHTNPWIGGLLICSAIFLYYLDSKEK